MDKKIDANKMKNILAEKNLELSKQWHPSKNGNLTPNDVTTGSGKKVWWKCKKGHEWVESISNRGKGRGCPFCSGRRVCNDNSLNTINPELAKQWHPNRNGNLAPNDVTTGSGKMVWWQCEKGHEWKSRIIHRTKGSGCPYCTSKLVYADNCLQNINPELAKQWHPTKNGDLTPYDVTASSGKLAWWQCEKGHVWKTTIDKRKSGNNCPFCAGKRVCVDNCLQTINPELAKQWHPNRNGNLTPNDVTTGSNKMVWWQCEKGHEWKAKILNRTNGRGCPDCNLESQTSFPEQAIYFYLKSVFTDTLNRYKLNNKWEIDVFVPSLNFAIEYDGIYFHKEKIASDIKKEKQVKNSGIILLKVKETEKYLKKYILKKNVIYCDRRLSENQLDKVILACFDYIKNNITNKSCIIDIDVKRDRSRIYELFIKSEKEKSLLVNHSELSKQWHPTKNLGISPDMVKPGSNKVFWWKCEKGHEWEAVISDRVNGNGCPFCSGRRVCKDNSLQKLNPKLARQWHPTKNRKLTPNDVTTGSGKMVWWRCDKGHEWGAIINSRTSGNSCPYCSGQRVCVDNSLQTINPKLSKQWHPYKNGELTPNDVTTGTDKRVWWKCEKGHEWEAILVNRVNGKGCPYCSGKRVCADNSLQKINPKLARQWHPTKNGKITPYDVTTGSEKVYWWQCEKGHEWKASINNRTKGRNCPYCSNKRVNVDNCLQTLNPELAKQWHPTKNGDLSPYDVTIGSSKKVWWMCKKGHDWITSINKRSKGSGCPYCSGRQKI